MRDRSVGKNDPFFGLEYLANRFNELRSNNQLAPDEREAWELAERVASAVVPDLHRSKEEFTTIMTQGSPPSLKKAIEYFNDFFPHDPVRLCLWSRKHGNKIIVRPGMVPPKNSRYPHMAEAASILWWHFFHDEGWERMHRCQVCPKWIVARGRNKIKRYCSDCGSDSYWTWERRHKSPKFGKRKKHKKGVQQ